MTDAIDVSRANDVMCEWLAESGLEWELGARDGEFVVTLPGEKKLKTVVSVLIQDRSLTAMAFVVRNPDENHEDVYRLLLQRNLRLQGAWYAIDPAGDIYLKSRIPLAAVSADEIDRLMGVMLDASDGIFNDVLAKGFLSSMKKEWHWRITHGESTRNLEAFKHLLDTDVDDASAGQR